jgi:hypothetical protein
MADLGRHPAVLERRDLNGGGGEPAGRREPLQVAASQQATHDPADWDKQYPKCQESEARKCESLRKDR